MELKKYKKKRAIPHGWKCVKVSDEFETSSGATPLTSERSYYENGDIPWVNSGELSSAYINSTENYITKAGFENSSTRLYPKETVLVAMYGATAGKSSLLNIEACTNQAICAILPHPLYSPKFLKYSIDTLYDYLVGLSSGSARDNLSQATIGDLMLIMPHLKEEQEKLIKILSLIDSKIELNCAINHNLEAMAKQLYDYWFVQFDFPNEDGKPYKSSGGEMVWNEKLKKKIPKGWHASNICKIATILSGGTPSKQVPKYWHAGSIPFFCPTDCDGSMFQISTSDHITQDGLNHCASSLFEEDTIIITARGSIGKLVIVGVPMAMNQSCYALKPNERASEYLYFTTFQLIESLKAKGSGSVFKSIISSDIENSTLCIADDNVVTRYDSLVYPMFQQIKTNTFEIKELIKQRDELLPLLMNGQVSVNYDLSAD